MEVDLKKMQNKVDKCMAVFTNIIDELSNQIGELDREIDSNNKKIDIAKAENAMYSEKIKEYVELKDKVKSIIK